MHEAIKVLDSGYVRFVEDWGRGDAGEPEAGIVEAARQSTAKGFEGFGPLTCSECEGRGKVTFLKLPEDPRPFGTETGCQKCKGSGQIPGDEKLLKYLSDHKHATPFEFAGMVIEVQAPIMVFREWHRHRTQAYNEMSARYTPLPDFNYLPTPERCLMVGGKNRQAGVAAGAGELTHEQALVWLEHIRDAYAICEKTYQYGLSIGVPKELARLCVPVGRYSRMRASTSLRCWLMFLTLRMAPDAQYEIRQFADAVGSIIADRFPRTWSLFNPPGVKA